MAEDLRSGFPSAAALRVRLLELVRARYVEVVANHQGRRIYALGPKGKQYLGIRSNWRTRPQEALRQVMWRRCHAQLVAEGYQRTGPWHGGLVLYRQDYDRALAVQVFVRGPSARHLRALLKRHRAALMRDGAVLCAFASKAWLLRTATMSDMNGVLRVRIPPAEPLFSWRLVARISHGFFRLRRAFRPTRTPFEATN